MKLRPCANIDLNPINIGENMKPEIIEALALELTKATIANANPLTTNIRSADLWVKTYLESEKQVKEVAAKANPPVLSISDIGIFETNR